MHIYYRISDKSYIKPKLPCCSKEYCFSNLYNRFKFGSGITVIADNCGPETLAMVRSYAKGRILDKGEVIETNLGNAGSFRYALSLAVNLLGNQVVYFVEDDYVHDQLSYNVIGESPTDYWTAYDHPDKYGPMYDYGETSKVFRSKYSRWRYTASTTMTFASRVDTLREDQDIWMKYTDGQHPNDHGAFIALGKKGRKLACTIPGHAWHTDLTESSKTGKIDMDLQLFHFLIDNIGKKIDLGMKMSLHNRVDQEPFNDNPLGPVEALAILEQLTKKAEK